MLEEKQQGRKGILHHWPLLVTVVVYLILSIIYSRAMPPFEGPDEAEHYAYIIWLAEGKGFPPQGYEAWDTPVRQEAGQSPLYYILASIPARLVDYSTPRTLYRPNPHAFTMSWPRSMIDNDNRALHYPDEALPLTGGWLALYTARMLSTTFGVLLLIGVYGLSREVFPELPELAWATTGMLAVTPQVLFISNVASNDIPAAALGTIALWALATLVKRGPTITRGLALGLAYGIAFLTKTSVAALAIPIGVAFLWLAVSKRSQLWQIVTSGIGAALGFFVTAGWWLFRSWRLYRSPLGLETHDLTPWVINAENQLAPFHHRWLDVFRSFWISFGWGTIRPPDWVYYLLEVLAIIAVIGLGLLLWRWWRRPDPGKVTRSILLGLFLLAVIGVGLSLEIWMRRVVAPYGRLMFPAAAAFSLLLVTGWYAINRRLPFIVIGLLALLSLTAPIWLIEPAFAHPDMLEPEEVAQLSSDPGWLFGPSAEEPIVELVSARPIEDEIAIGDPLQVELCWRVFQQTKEPYTVLVHVIGRENQLIANRRTYPGLGNYPTTIWQPGDVFCDQVDVNTRFSFVKKGVYWLEVALLNEATDERLPAFNKEGNLVTATFVDRVKLKYLFEEKWEPIAPGEGVEAFELISYNLPRSVQPSIQFDLILKWGVNWEVDRNYQLFVHIRDPLTNTRVAQFDGPPLDGWHPTSWWSAGEIIFDERNVTLPTDFPTGTYEVYVGFYDLETVQPFGKEHNLGSIEVQFEPGV